MGNAENAPTQVISLPKGGGAVQGIGETFSADPQTGAATLRVPIAVPAGRTGLAPKLELVYGTGTGSGLFGLGWALGIPGIARKTSHGVPRYDASDTFLLSGAEDLVPVEPVGPRTMRYRPRTEGLFAQIVHHRDPSGGSDHWEVTAKDGLVSRYGPGPATVVDPNDPRRIFAWKLTETRDPSGNVIVYEYGTGHGRRRG
jgi:hypothetical protein